MDQLLKLFDLFNTSAKVLASYIPQNGPELVELLKKALVWGRDIDVWLGNTFGVSIQKFSEVILRILMNSGEFILELVKQIANRA